MSSASSRVGQGRLSRQMNTSDAMIVGLGAMVGAGIFSVAGPVAHASGGSFLFSLIIAATAAYWNATSIAQLASRFPESGGAYVYGRNIINPLIGFVAGWSFLLGKVCSCAAMALTFGYYFVPEYGREAAALLTLLGSLVNFYGVKKTAMVVRVLVGLILTILGIVVFGIWFGNETPDSLKLFEISQKGFFGTLEGAALFFFAFAGYARVATLGEEVIKPSVNIPKAIFRALGITLCLYLVIGVTLLVHVPLDQLKVQVAPLAFAIESSSLAKLGPLVRWGGAIACMSVLLSLLAGLSRTAFAMARNGDLPNILGKVHGRYQTPYVADGCVCLAVLFLVSSLNLTSAIGFSSFLILTYYFIANVSAMGLSKEFRLYPKAYPLLGVLFCLTLSLSLPTLAVSVGVGWLVLGVLFFLLKKFFRAR